MCKIVAWQHRLSSDLEDKPTKSHPSPGRSQHVSEMRLEQGHFVPGQAKHEHKPESRWIKNWMLQVCDISSMYFKTCRHPKSFKSCQINMQILPAQHLLRPTAASLQELRNQCLTSKHIKTYQNISKHIKTYQNILKHIKTYQNISKRSICSPQQAQTVPAVPALNNTILHVGWMGSEIKQTGSVRLIAFVLACSFFGRKKIVGEFASFSKHWARVVRLA